MMMVERARDADDDAKEEAEEAIFAILSEKDRKIILKEMYRKATFSQNLMESWFTVHVT